MINSSRMRWQGMQDTWERRQMDTWFLWESQAERDNWENLDTGGRIILKWILEKQNWVV
jgi:hypothetical protein